MKNRKETMSERIRRRANDRRDSGRDYLKLPDGVELLKTKGKMSIDILPYLVTTKNHPEGVEKGETWHRRLYKVHKGVGAASETVVCPTSVGKKCPICEEFQRLRKDPDADEDTVKALRPKERELFNTGAPGEIKILDMSTFLFGDLLESEIRDAEEKDLITFDLKNGKTLKVRFVETKGDGMAFQKAEKITATDREDLDTDILEETVDLDSCLVVLDYEDLKEKMFGSDEEEDEDDDDDKKSSKKKKKSKDDDDEDEEEDEDTDEDEDEDEDEEEEKSSKKKKKSKSDADEDEEDEDEEEEDEEDDDDDDEEEDDKKSSKKKSKSKDEDDDDDEDADEEDDDDDDDEDEDDEESSKKPKGKPCVACEGSGKDTRGRTCPVCNGKGVRKAKKVSDEDEDDED